jgi:hypothetical protein
VGLDSKIGIDFIGFPKGYLGVGEQLRSLLRMAQINGYEINIIDCYRDGDKYLNNDVEFNSYISAEYKHKIRIYSATHNHIAALLWEKGFKFFDGAINIFHFAWEFSSIKEDLRPILSLSNSIWGISHFTASAFENQYDIPVEVMSNAVEVIVSNKYKRVYFGLPEDKFLFSTSFDLNSFMTRKNPMLVVESFGEAFSNNDNVGLVVKVSNSDKSNRYWNNFLMEISGMKNLYILDSNMKKEEVHTLFNLCDSYISLHRSEGFGYGIAENMLMSKPVVCTGFSGNMDFCNDSNSFLVDFDYVTVRENEYQHADGLFWANPKKKSAIEAMKKVYWDKDNSLKVGTIACNEISNNFSTKALAKKMDEKIHNIIRNFL